MNVTMVIRMNKLLRPVKESLSEVLIEINLRYILKTYLIVMIMLLLLCCQAQYLSQTEIYVVSVFKVHGITLLIVIINVFILFDIIRKAETRKFETWKCLKFISMFGLIYLILIPLAVLAYVTPAYYNLPSHSITSIDMDYLRLLYQNMSAVVIITAFIAFILFYAPFIQYIENKGFLYSLKKSIIIYIKKPVVTSMGILASFLLFMIPSIILMLPFTFKMSPVLSFTATVLFIPISIFPATFGMTIGTILMYAFAAKYYKKKLVETARS